MFEENVFWYNLWKLTKYGHNKHVNFFEFKTNYFDWMFYHVTILWLKQYHGFCFTFKFLNLEIQGPVLVIRLKILECSCKS